jgi:glycosyltransferase involved in cell wall biosynthesis
VVAEARQVVRAYDRLAGYDVIHDHTVFGPLYGTARSDAPIVATCHGPFTEETRDIYRAMSDRVAIVAISHHQRETAGDIPVAAVIHHGVDVDRMPSGTGAGGYAVFLGRMSPEKGADRAIRAARAASVPLVLAAKLREPAEQEYFLDQVEPLLGDDAVYVGEVGGARKLELLRGAVALLNPIRWPEPFGLVMIEALAVGTPVIAFQEGAVPEIVDDGVTGFVVSDERQMTVALKNVDAIRRSACREAAASRFSTHRMVADYRRLYRSLTRDLAADMIDFSSTRDQRAVREASGSTASSGD